MIQAWLKSQWYGLPKWAWCIMVILAIANEVIQRAKWTRAQSFFQAPFVALLRLPILGDRLGALPIVGSFLKWLAGIEPPKPAIELPSPVRSGEGGFIHFAVLAVLWATLIVGLALVFGGCCSSAAGSATCARKWVAGVYTGIGASSVMGLTCDATARAQGDNGNLSSANKTFDACKMLNTSLHVAERATDGTVAAIDAGERLGMKDYSVALAPAEDAVCDLSQAAQLVSVAIKKPLPVVIPCQGGK